MNTRWRTVTAGTLGLVLSLACAGAPTKTAPPQTPELTTAPDPPQALITLEQLDPKLSARFRTLKKGIDALTDDASFEKLWGEADSIAKDLERALHQREECQDSALGGLEKHVGMRVVCMNLGTVASVEMPGWPAYAAKTTGDSDDRFMALMTLAYGDDGPTWKTKVSEDQACSALGTGQILALFLAADAVGKDHFREPIANLRARILDGSTGAYTCYEGVDGPTSEDDLKGEVRKILAGVALSPEERETLEDALPTLKRTPFEG